MVFPSPHPHTFHIFEMQGGTWKSDSYIPIISCSHRDLNPSLGLERAVSLTGLDDRSLIHYVIRVYKVYTYRYPVGFYGNGISIQGRKIKHCDRRDLLVWLRAFTICEHIGMNLLNLAFT
jgi:hypothetical protein